MTCAVLRLNTTNPLSSKNLRLLLTIFISYPILSLTATLTPNGSSVPPPPHPKNRNICVLTDLMLVLVMLKND